MTKTLRKTLLPFTVMIISGYLTLVFIVNIGITQTLDASSYFKIVHSLHSNFIIEKCDYVPELLIVKTRNYYWLFCGYVNLGFLTDQSNITFIAQC